MAHGDSFLLSSRYYRYNRLSGPSRPSGCFVSIRSRRNEDKKSVSGRCIIAVLVLALAPLVAAGAERPWLAPNAVSQNEHAVGPADRAVRAPSSEALARPDGERVAPEFTLDALVNIAFQNNPTLAMAAARVNAARGMQVQAGLYPNPMIGYHGMEMGNEGTPGQQGGFVGQSIITGGKLKLDQAIAGRQVAESHCLFHAQEQRVLSDVRVRFYVALVTQDRLNVTRQLVRVGDDLTRATEQLVEGRQAAENDLLQAQIEADRIRIALDNTQNEYLEAWRRMSAVAGVPAMEPGTLIGDAREGLPQYDWAECCQLVLVGNPEVAAARQRVQRLRFAIARARKENIPNIDLLVGVRHVYPSDSDTASVEVGIPIPILNQNQGNITRAQYDMVMASKEVERLELDLQDRLATAYRRYQNASQQEERYRTSILPRAKRSLDLVTRGYEGGQVEYLMLLTTQRTFYQVNLAYLVALQDLRTSAAVIEGQLLSGSLGTASIPSSVSPD